ncbi:MAG: hypothetical protein ACP5QK_01675 [Myxococcota bacterium]
MKRDLRLLIHIISIIIVLQILLAITGISSKYYDIFLPIIPFFSLINNNSILILGYLIIGFISSIIHYDELFSIMLGYGVSIVLLLNFSRKYSLTNLINYIISIFAISLIVFTIQMLAYFAKDKVIVMRDMFQFLYSNIMIGLFYYYFYRVIFSLRNVEGVKR